MYAALVCFVFFDARGDSTHLDTMPGIAAALAVIMLAVRYVPTIFHRPQMVDCFCEDVLAITAHAACVSLIQNTELRYACALHSACYIMQHRFLDKHSVFVHTVTGALLLTAYVYCPRISEIRPLIVSVTSPHVVELFAKSMAHVHRMLVFWLTEV